MKRKIQIIGIIAILLSFWVSALAVDWKVTNQATIAWDAATTLIDGTPVPANNSVKYRVYMANAVTDPNKGNPVLLTQEPISVLEYIITLNIEGKYYVGVSAVRYDDVGFELNESVVNWSDVNGEATPNPFGFVHYIKMGSPKNLR